MKLTDKKCPKCKDGYLLAWKFFKEKECMVCDMCGYEKEIK